MSHRQRVGWAAVLCALSFAAVWLVQRAVHGSLVDVMVYRAAGRTVRDGGDLYAMHVTPAMLPMTYPPVAGLLFVPLTWLDVDRMRAAAIAGNLLLSVALAALSLRLVLRRTPSAAAVLATAAWAVWSEPVWATIRCGQINLLVVCLVLWDFTRRPANRWAGAGTGLAAALKVTPPCCSWCCWPGRQSSPAAAALPGRAASSPPPAPSPEPHCWPPWRCRATPCATGHAASSPPTGPARR